MARLCMAACAALCIAAVAARAEGEAAQEAEAPAKADAVSETETWNEGVECYRAGDTTNAVRLLRPLMLSREYGPRAAEVVAKLAYDNVLKGEGSALPLLEEAAAAAQLALRAAPDDERTRRNFARAVKDLPALRETKHLNDVVAAAQNKDKGAMMRFARDESRQLLSASSTYRTNSAAIAVAKADALSVRAEKLSDMWIPLKEYVVQAVTNQEAAAATVMQIDAARERTQTAAKALGDLEDGAYQALSEVEQDFSRFHKLTALPPDAIGEDLTTQSNAWLDVEAFNGNNWQQDALDYTQAFRRKFPMWAQQYEQLAQSDTNRPPFTAEQQAEISSLSTQLEKLQLECTRELLPPKQEEAIRIIERIIELMPPQTGGGGQGGQQNQQNQQQNQQPNQDQQNQDQKNQQDDKQDLGQAPDQQEQEAEEREAKESEGEKSPDDKEVEALLKKAQERTDEHEEEKRRRMRRATLPPNERDW